jgi:hypothetical protein
VFSSPIGTLFPSDSDGVTEAPRSYGRIHTAGISTLWHERGRAFLRVRDVAERCRIDGGCWCQRSCTNVNRIAVDAPLTTCCRSRTFPLPLPCRSTDYPHRVIRHHSRYAASNLQRIRLSSPKLLESCLVFGPVAQLVRAEDSSVMVRSHRKVRDERDEFRESVAIRNRRQS